jgi:hypothetical protein
MSDERKTLEQRSLMTDIERLRHSAAHVMATAILKLWHRRAIRRGPDSFIFLRRERRAWPLARGSVLSRGGFVLNLSF